ncbi:MAG: ribosome maturation factor RimM [Alphaproteobacteria bacterium]|nr:ribosome maturation factor RimM [Alphaproteobacteria bacterium]
MKANNQGHITPLPVGEGNNDRLHIATIIDAHGIKGWVKLRLNLDTPETLSELGPLYTSPAGEKTLALTVHSLGGKAPLVSIEGVTDRNAAESLKGTALYADRAVLPALHNRNTYYATDLTGLQVSADGQNVGQVMGVENYGAGDLLDIALTNGQRFLLPFHENWVGTVDLHTRTVSLHGAWADFTG